VVDVSNAEQVSEAADEVLTTYGAGLIYYLINAGIVVGKYCFMRHSSADY